MEVRSNELNKVLGRKTRPKQVLNVISISIGLVYIVTRQTGSFSSQRQKKKKRTRDNTFWRCVYKRNGKKYFNLEMKENDQTADFCFGNGRINKQFATTAAG